MDSNSDFNSLVGDVENYLKTLKQYGVDSFLVEPGHENIQAEFFAKQKKQSMAYAKNVCHKVKRKEKSILPEPSVNKENNLKSEIEKDTLDILNQNISNCCFCKKDNDFRGIGLVKIPLNVKVLFVTDFPKDPENKRIFSNEERDLFKNILKAMGLGINEVFVIPAIRCRCENENPANALSKLASTPCNEFFKRSLSFIKPRVICFLSKDIVNYFNKSDLSTKNGMGCLFDIYPFYCARSLQTMIFDRNAKRESWSVFQNIMNFL